jgi:hypothetical protein
MPGNPVISEDREIAAKDVWFHGHENGSDCAIP